MPACITLSRPNLSTPWGISIRGGVDVLQPVTVTRITPNSPAAAADVRPYDVIDSIEQQLVAQWSHQQCVEAVKGAGLTLTLSFASRGAGAAAQVTLSRDPIPQPPQVQPPAPSVMDSMTKLSLSNAPKRLTPAVPGLPSSVAPDSGRDPHAAYKVFPDQELYQQVSSGADGGSDRHLPQVVVKCLVCLEPITHPDVYFVVANNPVCDKDYRCAVCKVNLKGRGCCLVDRVIYCKDHNPVKAKLSCPRCSQLISGAAVSARDCNWHPHCFICAICTKPIGNQSFIECEDPTKPLDVVCEPCYKEKMAPRCDACHAPIDIDSRVVEVGGKQFHDTCLLCAECKTPLAGKRILNRNGVYICTGHMGK